MDKTVQSLQLCFSTQHWDISPGERSLLDNCLVAIALVRLLTDLPSFFRIKEK